MAAWMVDLEIRLGELGGDYAALRDETWPLYAAALTREVGFKNLIPSGAGFIAWAQSGRRPVGAAVTAWAAAYKTKHGVRPVPPAA